MNISISFLIFTLIQTSQAFKCEEFMKSSNYKGSCCTLIDFNPYKSDYSIEIFNSTRITKVRFVNFQYKVIPEKIFEMNDGIMEMNLTKGNLESIQTNAFVNAGHLNFLMLSNNRLRGLKELSFEGARYLYKLDLKENFISEIDPMAFQGLEFLSYLYLDSNKIETIDSKTFQPLKRLFKLTLSNNQIKLLNPNTVYMCFKLDHLDLSKNLLTGTITLQNRYNELSFLNIAENLINSFEIFAESSIKARKLQLTIIGRNNKLSNITVSNNYNLSYLNLYDNQIGSIRFIIKDHCNVSHINIGKNPLNTQEVSDWFGQLRKLKYLNMSLVKLKNLSDTAFVDLPNLQILDISNVNLKQPFDLSSLKYLKNLEVLDMSNVYIIGMNMGNIERDIKHFLPNLKCFKYNNTNGWICNTPFDENELIVNEIRLNLNSNSIPIWTKVSIGGSCIVIVLICIFGIWIRKRKEHQIINNINIGSTTTELELL